MNRFLPQVLSRTSSAALRPLSRIQPLCVSSRRHLHLHPSAREIPDITRTEPPTKSETELAKMNYVVRRTVAVKFPVYRRKKERGTYLLLKRADGDLGSLLRDLVKDLDIPRNEARVNPITRHIELKDKPNRIINVRDWLVKKGF